MDKQDQRDKRVVGAAIIAAIVVAIAILAIGWFVASRDGDGTQAGDPTPGATPTVNAGSDGPTAPTETGVAADQTQPSQATGADSTGTGAVESTPGQAATGRATGNLLTSPTTAGGSIGQDAAQTTGSADSATTQPSTQTATQTTAQSATPQLSGPSPGDQAAASQTTAQAGSGTEGQAGGRTILTDEQVAVLPPIMPPSFDVVRVNELGDAVIAGRAEPRSIVIIYDGDREIGRVAADSRGEWVFVSDRPLVPGQHEIGLLSLSGPQSRLSDQIVVLIAPEPRQDIAGQPSEGDAEREKPLALLVPRDEIGATTVLQSPPAVATGSASDAPASPAGAGVASGPASDPGSPGSTPDGDAPVSIDVVDYDEAGRLIVSGRSTPQSDVRLYLDNQYVGTARTDSEGSFQVQPAQPVEPGVYALRVDEVSPVGSVTARAETPFQRAREVPDTLPGHSRIVVQPGNSLWRIARQVYGQGIQYTVIYQANTGQIRNPDLIYPGQIFSVPTMPTEVPAGDPS